MKNPTWRKVWREPAEAIAPTLTPEQAYNWKLQLEPPPLPSYPLHQQCVREILLSHIGTLTPKEQDVVRWRFGIDCQELTLKEVGARLGCGPEYARHIETRSLQKLRWRLAKNLDAIGVIERAGSRRFARCVCSRPSALDVPSLSDNPVLVRIGDEHERRHTDAVQNA